MNKSKFYGPDKSHLAGFLVCAALFVLGCIAGAIASNALPQDTPVNEYVVSLAGAESRGFGARFLSALRISGKYHVLVLVFAFSVLGVVAIPSISALRGFLLCFAVASIIRYYGSPAVPYVLLMFAPEALIAVPGLFLLSTHSLSSSVALLGACTPRGMVMTPPFDSVFVSRAAICAALLGASALIDAAIGPWLAGRFPL